MENAAVNDSECEQAVQDRLDQQAKRKEKIAKVLPFAGLIFIFLFFLGITDGKIISPSNIENLINQAFAITIIAVGAAFVYAHGGMDFSLGAASGVAQLVGALLITKTSAPLWVSILACILTGVACSAIVGGASNLFKVPVFIASLCMRTICMGILATVVSSSEIIVPFNEYKFINNASVKTVIAVIVIAIGVYLFEYTRIGKYEKAVGGNSLTAAQAGVRTDNIKFLAYIFLGVCVGIASVFMMFRSSTVTAQSGNGMEFNTMIAIVLGGFPMTGGDTARIRATIIGAITITLLTNGLIIWGLDPNLVNGLKGVLFLVIVGLSYDRSKGKLVS